MKRESSKKKSFRRELIEQFITLSTSGFGLAAGLAWNEAIQTFVKEYVQKFYPDLAGFISKFIYAILITAFAVLITYQLSKLASKWSSKK